MRGQGAHWAEALESTPGSPFWIVSRYDWSDPTTVRWVVTECSYGGGGAGFAHISPGKNGGSRMHVEWTLDDPTRQKALLWLYRHAPMRPLIRRLWVSALDRYAAENAA
ncbi:hypothetical protein [Demequina silvatica]|uniref:hypothetical protein n=1 Tax=Demequina silvatica TaxID=1638988 RepID=UPI00078592F3|nr:hypothetical protein [Demequina silvatica]